MEIQILKKDQIDQVVEFLRNGELVAFSTETVCGLGATATKERSVKNVYKAKGRPSDNPLIVTVSDEDMMKQHTKFIPERAEKLIKHFWPDPLTLLLLVRGGSLPTVVTGGLKTAAFRRPDDESTHELISKLGYPIAGLSANTSTRPPSATAKHVYHDLKGEISAIIDGGVTEVGLESTIIDSSVEAPIVLWPDQITPEELNKVLGEKVLINTGKVSDKTISKTPGMKYRRYVPSALAWAVDDVKDFSKTSYTSDTVVAALDGVLDTLDLPAENKFSLGRDLKDADHNLFSVLRFFDDEASIKTIYAQGFDEGEQSLVYMNRLNRAAAGHYYKN